MNKSQAILIGIVVLVLGGLFVFTTPSPVSETQTTRTNREIATTCDKEMAQGYHIHPTLEIIVNGENIPIPPNVGVQATCMTALHTHSPDGLIHVESPEKRDFTLADFFAVWNKPFSKDQILNYRADENHKITVKVNDQIVETFEQTVLKDKDRIVITYELR